jgi:DNA polymerase-3 subunit epsilon
MPRQIVLDIETTELYVHEGHRIVEIAAVEMKNGKPTGREFHVYLNPDRPISPEISKIHGLTNEFLADKPRFPEIAKELYSFIGNSPIVITCRTEDNGYVLDKAFLSAEMEQAGLPPFKDEQWINVRKWSESMFGDKQATLNKVLDRYKIDRSERDNNGHGALLDARLLAMVYPKLRDDYTKFSSGQKTIQPASKNNPPAS